MVVGSGRAFRPPINENIDMNATVTIGRSSECNIMVSDGNVSRIHARISRVGGQYVFEDVSSNGSVLNGQVIHGRRITVAPAPIFSLAGRVPFPWNEVYKMLPMGPGLSLRARETQYNNLGGNPGYAPAYNDEDRFRQASGFSLSSSPSLDGFSGEYGTTVFPTVPAASVKLPGLALALT